MYMKMTAWDCNNLSISTTSESMVHGIGRNPPISDLPTEAETDNDLD